MCWKKQEVREQEVQGWRTKTLRLPFLFKEHNDWTLLTWHLKVRLHFRSYISETWKKHFKGMVPWTVNCCSITMSSFLLCYCSNKNGFLAKGRKHQILLSKEVDFNGHIDLDFHKSLNKCMYKRYTTCTCSDNWKHNLDDKISTKKTYYIHTKIKKKKGKWQFESNFPLHLATMLMFPGFVEFLFPPQFTPCQWSVKTWPFEQRPCRCRMLRVRRSFL